MILENTMSIIKNFFFIATIFILSSNVNNILLIEAAPEDALVNYLPGFKGTFPSKHYSGFVKIDGSPKKNLFYYFVESERNSSNDPLVLWLNGGPGCSSFDGFIYEHGPFNFQAAKTKGALPVLHLNPYSWSKVSNMIYLDSPSGVGLSYPAPNKTGDIQTAKDTHAFLLKWLKLYPEFLSNPFYIAGESYAGIYVPTLASQIDKGIKSAVQPIINFKGYLIGNGVCDDYFDGNNALVSFVHGMGLIPNSLFKEAEVTCKGKYQGSLNQSCLTVLDKIDENIDGLNIYDILEPCDHDDAESFPVNSILPVSFKQLGKSNERSLPVRKRMFGRAWPYRAPVKPGLLHLWPELMSQGLSEGFAVPCMNDVVATTWLNDKGVRQAIHASQESGNWTLCGGLKSYYSDAGSMISYHKNLTVNGYRALIYSGDHDMCVPFTGTEAWVDSLGYAVEDEWRPWISNQQTAGFTQKYAYDLTFLTIKGAGHTVPEYKPREALDFYSRWLQGQKI